MRRHRHAPAALAAVTLLACAPLARGPLVAAEEAPSPPLRIGLLVVDGVYGTELTAPYDVLEHAARLAGDGATEIFTVSPDGDAVTTAEGLQLLPRHGFDSAPPVDVLVVPSAVGSRDADLADERLIAWVAAAGARARRVLSLCWGAFVLAEAGLLDGHAATTFPDDYAAFAAAFPDVDLKLNVSFVHDGKLVTSQGGVRSYEAALYLAADLFGEEVATRVGRGLLVAWPPDPAVPFISAE